MIIQTDVATQLVKYSVTDAEIAILRERFDGLTCDTPQQYEVVRVAIAEIRDLRVAIEKRRIELKADALEYGRRVDREASRITRELEQIEAPLKERKRAIDDERERIRQQAIEAKRREIEAQLRAQREAEERALKALRDAEDRRLAAARAQLELDRRTLEEDRQRAEAVETARRRQEQVIRAAVEAERQAVQQARERIEREAFEQHTRIEAERKAIAQVELDRIAALERAAQVAAVLPDVEKVFAFTSAIRGIPVPTVKSTPVKRLVNEACASLADLAWHVETKVRTL